MATRKQTCSLKWEGCGARNRKNPQKLSAAIRGERLCLVLGRYRLCACLTETEALVTRRHTETYSMSVLGRGRQAKGGLFTKRFEHNYRSGNTLTSDSTEVRGAQRRQCNGGVKE